MGYVIEARTTSNPMILNERPHRWFGLGAAKTQAQARKQIAELRKGAKQAKLDYVYRMRAVGDSPLCALGFGTLRQCPNLCKGSCGYGRDI